MAAGLGHRARAWVFLGALAFPQQQRPSGKETRASGRPLVVRLGSCSLLLPPGDSSPPPIPWLFSLNSHNPFTKSFLFQRFESETYTSENPG